MDKKIIRWDTPFTDTRWPSVILITVPTGDNYPVEVIVSPGGIEEYPKYIINFGDVIAFSCMEEAHFPERDIAEAECLEEGLSAYEFIGSTWLESYKNGDGFLFNINDEDQEELRHFLIFGGDNNVEVITKNAPTFRRIDSQQVETRSFTI